MVFETSEPDTTGTDVTIGEIVTFQIEFAVPPTTVQQITLVDTLPTNLAYIAGSARLARTFDVNLTASDNPGGINTAASGVFVGLTDGTDVVLSGQDVTLALGDVTSLDFDADDETYTLEIQTIVQNAAANESGVTFTNEARLTYLNHYLNVQQQTISGPTMLVVEPMLAITHTASPTTLNKAVGGTVAFTITVENTGDAAAYDLDLLDSLPGGLQSISNVAVSSTGATGIVNDSTSNRIDLFVSSLQAGGQVIVTFNALAPPPVASLIINIAAVTWTSLPGVSGTGGLVTGLPGTTLGEREAGNDYRVTGRATISGVVVPTATTTPSPTLTAVLVSPTSTATSTPTVTMVGTALVTPTATSSTPSPTSTITPTTSPTSSAPTPTASVTPTFPTGSMGVRFVSVGRTKPGSEITYSAVLLTYSRATVPNVRAQLTLPPELVFVSALPPPAAAPSVGSNGVISWELGNITGPANQSLEVRASVRADTPFNTNVVVPLHIENDVGETFDVSRTSRIGKADKARPDQDKRPLFRVLLKGPKRITAGASVTYGIRATSMLRGGFPRLVVRAVVPSTLQIQSVSPPAVSVDAPVGSDAVIEWQFTSPGNRVNLSIQATASPALTSGAAIETFVTLDDGEGTQSLVFGSAAVP